MAFLPLNEGKPKRWHYDQRFHNSPFLLSFDFFCSGVHKTHMIPTNVGPTRFLNLDRRLLGEGLKQGRSWKIGRCESDDVDPIVLASWLVEGSRQGSADIIYNRPFECVRVAPNNAGENYDKFLSKVAPL